MALPKHYLFRVKNETGVTVLAGELRISIARKKRGPADNALVYENPAAILTNASNVVNGGSTPLGLVQSNATNLWEEGDGTFDCTISTATPNGNLTLFIGISSDGSLVPDQARMSFPISVMNVTTAVAFQRTDFKF